MTASQAVRRPEQIPDVDGQDLRPDPLAADTPAEFVACLRCFRTWAGQPTLREIATRSRQAVSYTTIQKVLARNDLPSLTATLAILTGCGATHEYQQSFATAWRRLTMADVGLPENAIGTMDRDAP
jgi:hypothetical protein